MPFEIAEKSEQEQRVALGRIALEAIAAHILTVPPESFNMRSWCGTACCAIGHGLALSEVKATGLHRSKDGFPRFGKIEYSHAAIAAAFGIRECDSDNLFRPTGNDSPYAVSNRIRGFLAGWA